MGQIFSQDSADNDQQKIYNSMQEIFEGIKAKMYIAAFIDECLPIVCAVYKFHEFLLDANYENDDRLKAEIENRLQKHLSGQHLDQLVELMTVGVLKSVTVLLPASTTSPPATATSKESVQQICLCQQKSPSHQLLCSQANPRWQEGSFFLRTSWCHRYGGSSVV